MTNFSVKLNHADFVILDKPAGIGMHSEQQAGLVVQASQQLGIELYPVHRLDKVTSGLLILAKHADAAARFGQLFEQHAIGKQYLAVSDRKPSKKQGWIKGDMCKSRRGSWKLLRTLQAPAVTQFVSAASSAGHRLYLLQPHTGRTHQLRVAMKSIGAPILGDSRYGGSEAPRTLLHACQLHFVWQTESITLCSAPTEPIWLPHLPALPNLQQKLPA